jgi:hypothetical protein
MRRLVIIVFLASFFLAPSIGMSQNVGIGGDLQYNFETNGVGLGLRASIFPDRKLSITPEFSYYPGFNQVQEFFIGVAAEYKVFKVNNFNFYAIGQLAYNDWISYKTSPEVGAKPNNLDLELGGGVTTNKCLRPFLEWRYNAIFREANIRLGLLYIIGCGGGSSSPGKSSANCPTF